MIPARDRQGHVQAVLRGTGGGSRPKYPWMSGGGEGRPSSGAPAHFAQPYLADIYPCDPIVVTEGVLKSQVISHLLHVAVIGFAGAGSIAPIDDPGTLEWLTGRRVLIAYDADANPGPDGNPHVWKALVDLTRKLTAAGIQASALEWPETLAKGLDDLLIGVTS